MSDTFDHMMDAYEYMNDCSYDPDEMYEYAYPRKRAETAIYKYDRIVAETEKAYLVSVAFGKNFWVPKALCVYFNSNIIEIYANFEPQYV